MKEIDEIVEIIAAMQHSLLVIQDRVKRVKDLDELNQKLSDVLSGFEQKSHGYDANGAPVE